MSTWKMQDFTPEGTPDHTYEIISAKSVPSQQGAHPQASCITVEHKLETAFCTILHSAAWKKLWSNESCNYNLCIINQWKAVTIWLKTRNNLCEKCGSHRRTTLLSYLDHLAGPHISSVALSQEKKEPRLLFACCATHWRTLKSCFSTWRSDVIVSESRTRRSNHSSVPVAALGPCSTRTRFQWCFWTPCSLRTCCCDIRSDERETSLAGCLAVHALTQLGRTGRVSEF